MADPVTLTGRLTAILLGTVSVLKLVVLYLSSELLIWGCSRILSLLNAPFFASIVAMTLVAMAITATAFFSPLIGLLYEKHVKSEVNLINSHLGVGFAIPLVMLDENSMLNGLTIARIIGAFVITNLLWWPACFTFSYLAVRAGYFLLSRPTTNLVSESADVVLLRDLPSRSDAQSTHRVQDDVIKDPSLGAGRQVSIDSESLQPRTCTATLWDFLGDYYPLVVSITCAMVIGGPVTAATQDPRILDGCMLWFIWYMTVKCQIWLKKDTRWKLDPRLKRILVTSLNPVLLTTLLALAYTRLRSLAHDSNLARVLRDFSRGNPLYAIWTSSVTGSQLPNNPDLYFGAGDLALSILECGIVMWGFKLYECRQQLFSFAGLLTVLISIAAAAGNVFVCAAVARGIGLDQGEALSFSARSTTLALAKPAIDTVRGNLAVNAALVVSNGILGQLMYPYILPRINVESDNTTQASLPAVPTNSTESSSEPQPGIAAQPAHTKRYDTPITIAAGIAIGINGAAMGVAYLYENKSRAAPYSALSMTIFGVFTVVFITVDPFRSALVALASF